MPRISVVVPAFNEEKYIADCLQALRAQEPDGHEIIVVDNASTDNTSEVAEQYADKVVYESRKGIAFARQRGFEEAKGDIIASTDADTIVAEDWLRRISRAFDDGVVCVYGPVHLWDGSSLEKILARHAFTAFLATNHILGRPHLVGSNFAVKKNAFDATGFDLTVKSAEDVTLGLRLRKHGRIKFHPRMRVFTSARRLRAGRMKFLSHHVANFFSTLALKKTKSFEDIR